MKLVEREVEILNETNYVQVTRACDNVESKKIRDVEANGKFEILLLRSKIGANDI